jgi:RNA polymerase sigma-70 factor, ECF subfamily
MSGKALATPTPLRACLDQRNSLADTESFDQLYRTSRDRLAVQLAALTGNSAEANDVVQEAFMRAWLRWEAVGAYDDPEGWVRRVAHNLAVSRWRRAKKLVLRASLPAARTEIPGERMAIVAALQALPVAERRAIVLHHVAGLSVVDTARELRAPEGTVKSWLSRGRSRLASELDRPEQQPRKQQPRKQQPRREVAPPEVVVDPRKDPADD